MLPEIQLDDCWAKTFPKGHPHEGHPALTVLTHSLNAWAVGRIAENLVAFSGIGSDLLPWVLSIHDIGKISLGFQQQSLPWIKNHGLETLWKTEQWDNAKANARDHGRLTGKTIVELGLLPGQSGEKLALLIASHHGRLYPYAPRLPFLRKAPEKHHGASFAALRAELVEELKGLCKLPFPLPESQIPKETAILLSLAGWVTVCDWIASDERFFGPPSHRDPDRAKQTARKALHSLGWTLPVACDKDFSGLFGDATPRPLQKELHKVCTKPGIYIVEAQMGDGKSKAALWAGHRLVKTGQARGFYFALPTQVTSDRVCQEAMIPFVEAGFDGRTANIPEVKLIHGAAWLNDTSHPEWHATIETEKESTIPKTSNEGAADAIEWFHGNKRALLAPFGVGTVDQALYGVLPVKHFFVRLAALSGKVVILDEIHSYDVYTGSLIEHLITLLSKIGSSVVILSATLTRANRERLLAAAGISPPPENTSGETDVMEPPTRITHAPWPSTGEHRAAKTVRCASSFKPKTISLTLRPEDEQITARELVARASVGQRVLWIRNSVANAIAAKRLCATLLQQQDGHTPPCGVLHSRFTWHDRQRNEEKWIALYQNRKTPGGCILIATQVAEQSLNLDSDFLVTDLAPTDMMLQRLGRLWRFPETPRPAGCDGADARIIVPDFEPDDQDVDPAEEFKEFSRVYDPYILLRTWTAWGKQKQSKIVLPRDIQPLLEATYADPSPDEPAHWGAFANKLQVAIKKQADQANGVTDIWGLGTLDIKEDDPFANLSTRLIRFPTLPLVLLAEPVPLSEHEPWRFLNGTEQMPPEPFSKFRDSLPFRREIFRNSVKIPAWFLPKDETWFPPVLERLRSGPIACAWVNGEKVLPWDEGPDERDESQAIKGMIYRLATGLNLPARTPPRIERISPDELLMEAEW